MSQDPAYQIQTPRFHLHTDTSRLQLYNKMCHYYLFPQQITQVMVHRWIQVLFQNPDILRTNAGAAKLWHLSHNNIQNYNWYNPDNLVCIAKLESL